MEIDYINGVSANRHHGISKYQTEIHKRIKSLKLNIIEYDPAKFVVGNIDIANALKLYGTYPLIVKKNSKKDNLKHITAQNLAYLLKLLNLKNSIVTCYDLIPLIYENNHSPLFKFNIGGLKKADRIITISEFSKNDIINYLGYPADKIDIVYPAVDHDTYYMIKDKSILKELNIPEDSKTIIYVGSEHPRQNVPVIIKAFAKLKKKLPNIKLLKIGQPQTFTERKNNLELIRELDLQKDIIFIDYVSEEKLPKLYNAADLSVYPCAYAGFGMPPLEAMACGTPVITSNTTSLPEVVGEAGITIDPTNIDTLTNEMYEILTNKGLREDLSKRGLKRSKIFNWNESAKKTLKIYEQMH